MTAQINTKQLALVTGIKADTDPTIIEVVCDADMPGAARLRSASNAPRSLWERVAESKPTYSTRAVSAYLGRLYARLGRRGPFSETFAERGSTVANECRFRGAPEAKLSGIIRAGKRVK